jgi:hypothetical protein
VKTAWRVTALVAILAGPVRPRKMRLPLRRGRSEENWENACYEGNNDAATARKLGFKWFPGVTPPK